MNSKKDITQEIRNVKAIDLSVAKYKFNGIELSKLEIFEGKSEDNHQFTNCSFTETSFKIANYDKINFSGSTFNNVTFEEIDMSKSNLSDCKFNKCTINTDTFRNSKISQSTFTECTFLSDISNFSENEKLKFKKCTFKKAILPSGVWKLEEFDNCTLIDCTLDQNLATELSFSIDNISSIDILFNRKQYKVHRFIYDLSKIDTIGTLKITSEFGFNSFKDKIAIKDVKIKKLEINSNRTNSIRNINITKCDIDDLSFENVDLINLKINNTEIDKFSLNKCSVDNVEFEDVEISISLKVSNLKKIKKFKFINGKIKEASFHNNIEINSISFENTEMLNTTFEGTKIKGFALQNEKKKTINLKFIDITFESNKLNFSNLDLSKIAFDKVKGLKNIDFSNSKIFDSKNFKGIDAIKKPSFSNTNLSNFDFSDIEEVQGCDFSDVKKYDNTKFNTRFRDCTFKIDKKFGLCSFDDAKLINCRFVDSDFSGISFRKTVFETISEWGTKEKKLPFLNAKFGFKEDEKTKFNDCSFTNKEFNNFDLRYCQFERCDWDQTELINSDFSNTNWIPKSRGKAYIRLGINLIKKCHFDNCNMENVNFVHPSRVLLNKWVAYFPNSKLTNSNFDGITFSFVDFSYATLVDAILPKAQIACLDKANLKNAEIRHTVNHCLHDDIDDEPNNTNLRGQISKADIPCRIIGKELQKYLDSNSCTLFHQGHMIEDIEQKLNVSPEIIKPCFNEYLAELEKLNKMEEVPRKTFEKYYKYVRIKPDETAKDFVSKLHKKMNDEIENKEFELEKFQFYPFEISDKTKLFYPIELLYKKISNNELNFIELILDNIIDKFEVKKIKLQFSVDKTENLYFSIIDNGIGTANPKSINIKETMSSMLYRQFFEDIFIVSQKSDKKQNSYSVFTDEKIDCDFDDQTNKGNANQYNSGLEYRFILKKNVNLKKEEASENNNNPNQISKVVIIYEDGKTDEEAIEFKEIIDNEFNDIECNIRKTEFFKQNGKIDFTSYLFLIHEKDFQNLSKEPIILENLKLIRFTGGVIDIDDDDLFEFSIIKKNLINGINNVNNNSKFDLEYFKALKPSDNENIPDFERHEKANITSAIQLFHELRKMSVDIQELFKENYDWNILYEKIEYSIPESFKNTINNQDITKIKKVLKKMKPKFINDICKNIECIRNKKRKYLLIDDKVEILQWSELFRLILCPNETWEVKNNGYRSTKNETLTISESFDFKDNIVLYYDIVILDLYDKDDKYGLPETAGTKFLKQLSQKDKLMPVVMFSSTEKDYRDELIKEYHIDGWIKKKSDQEIKNRNRILLHRITSEIKKADEKVYLRKIVKPFHNGLLMLLDKSELLVESLNTIENELKLGQLRDNKTNISYGNLCINYFSNIENNVHSKAKEIRNYFTHDTKTKIHLDQNDNQALYISFLCSMILNCKIQYKDKYLYQEIEENDKQKIIDYLSRVKIDNYNSITKEIRSISKKLHQEEDRFREKGEYQNFQNNYFSKTLCNVIAFNYCLTQNLNSLQKKCNKYLTAYFAYLKKYEK